MVLNNLKELIDARGITRYQFWKETEFNKATAYRLYDEPEYIPGREVMERIAEVYGWEPKEYIVYIPNDLANLAQRLVATN
ncbi:helix-turn-helix domain-containing protein [Chroococcidiopsis sp.]|uniref:helix-turn-helix domain-containing protein n=1 Tax=Chroococcidiopsis sp. TaxID=3088168 RepID=UPI003F311595